jgi:hypothetical protein
VLRSLVDLFIAFTDLLQAYARQLQESAKQTALKVGIFAGLGVVGLVLASSFMFFSSGLLLYALYLVLLDAMSPAAAALVTGLIVWLVIGGAAWFAVRRALR